MDFHRRSSGNFWLAVALVIFAGTGFIGFKWWGVMASMQEAITLNARIETNVSQNLETATTAYQNEKEIADEEAAASELALASILPTESAETSLTRMFDAYVAKHDYANSPLFLETLSFGTAAVDEKSGASYLPVDLSLSGSRDNFFGFLSYVENSGGFADQVRLMDIEAVSVTVSEDSDAAEGTGAAPMVSFSLSIRAYSASNGQS